MTPLPEAHLPSSAIFAARFSAALDAVTIASGFVRFLPSYSPFFRALLYSSTGGTGTNLFSFCIYLVSRILSRLCPPFLLSTAVLVAATPVLFSLPACSSIPVLWDLARERLSSYIEKSSGREKNWRYLYRPLCSSSFLS